MMTPSSLPVLNAFLGFVLPGISAAMQRIREEVVEFALNPVTKTLLVEGPIGAGKSTLARTIGMVMRIAPLTEEAACKYVELTRFDETGRVALILMPWYVELALTGLTENLVDAQLFGSIKGSYTDAPDRAGVFELAKTGRRKPNEAAEPGAQLTNGVVFLDEIGDLSLSHQAKLLPVFSGGVFYRLGAEGNPKHELQYEGTTIAASWRPLEGLLRPDLYSRISAYKIQLPGLADRMDDFDLIVDGLQTIVLDGARGEIDRMIQVEQVNLDRRYWSSRRDAMGPLNKESRRHLSRVDWTAQGNMRGLMVAIQKIVVSGKSAEEAISSLAEIRTPRDLGLDAPTLLHQLLRRPFGGRGLASRMRDIEVEQRCALRDFLLSDRSARKRLADVLGLDDAAISTQIYQLGRRRTRDRDGGKSN